MNGIFFGMSSDRAFEKFYVITAFSYSSTLVHLEFKTRKIIGL